MRLTQKLLGFLHRVFNKDPMQFFALRLAYNGGMTWSIADGVLTTAVVGGPGAALSVNLRNYTVRSLVAFLSAQPGYSVLYADGSGNAGLNAAVLIDGAGDIGASNGDHLYGYTSFLWAYIEAQAIELQAAADQVENALAQLSVQTAGADWLDEWGSYFAIPRLQGESDAQYAPRMVVEILRPRNNNIAIESAIFQATGQRATVTDVIQWGNAVPAYDATISYNGAKTHNAAPKMILGLFDVQYSYDLLGGTDVASFKQQITDLINRLRAAGTQMRALSLQSSAISDAGPPAPTDGDATQALALTYATTDAVPAPADSMPPVAVALSGLQDTAAGGSDTSGLTLTMAPTYSYGGNRSYNGAITHSGGAGTTETL